MKNVNVVIFYSDTCHLFILIDEHLAYTYYNMKQLKQLKQSIQLIKMD